MKDANNPIFSDFHGEEDRNRLLHIASSRTTPPEIVKEVLKKSIGKTPASMHRILQGEANEVYIITTTDAQEVVLRLSHKETNRFEFEAWAIGEVKKRGVPVPDILALGEYETPDKKLYYSVQRRITGRTLDNLLWADHISPERAKKITERAGEILAHIHSITGKGAGKLIAPGQGIYAEAYDRLARFRSSERAAALQVALDPYKKLSVPNIETIFAYLEEHIAFGADKHSLLHSDFGPKHLFISDRDEIVGLIDFEEVQIGDPAAEFARWDFWFRESVPTKWLEDSYERISSLGDHYQERFACEQVFNLLGLLNYYTYDAPATRFAEQAALRIKELVD